MTEFKVAISIEPKISEYSTPPNPLDSFLKIEGYRRLLEDKVQIKQLGQGLFTASVDEKHAVFDAIEDLDMYASDMGLRAQPFLIEPLDTELKIYQRLKYPSPREQLQSSSTNRVERSKEFD